MSTISSTISPYEFTRVRPLKAKPGEVDDPNEASAPKLPAGDILRMIAGVLGAQDVKSADPKPAVAGNDAQNIYAQIQLGGKTVATIYNSGAVETSNALGQKAKLSDGEGPDLAQKRAEELAAASGGSIVKSAGALNRADWQAQQAEQLASPQWDAVAREKQRSYFGLQERAMIADPSMLVQAQLFAQQMDPDLAPSPAQRPIVRSDTMTSSGAQA